MGRNDRVSIADFLALGLKSRPNGCVALRKRAADRLEVELFPKLFHSTEKLGLA